MYFGLHIKHPLFLCDLIKLEFSREIFEEHRKAKFHENPYSERQVAMYGQTDMTNLRAHFLNFANAPKITVVDGGVLLKWILKGKLYKSVN
jgi:hypothetical protein